MYKNILVPVDFSEHNEPALNAAVALARPDGKVRLFHVIEPIAGIDVADEEEFFRRLEERARKVLLRHGQRLHGAGVEWDSEVVYGKRAREIVERAAKMNADLIVLASHRIDPSVPGGGWGTLSYQVAIMAECAVLLVK